MKTLKNLNLYLNRFDLILFFYFSFIFILPPLLGDGVRNNQYYHFTNIFVASIILFWGFFFKIKNYHIPVLFFFGFIFLVTITSNYFHFRSLIFFYYFFVMLFASLIIIENVSLEKLIKVYCTICYILSIYAVYEFVNPLEKFEIGGDLENRANSVFREPSHFASTIIPSLAYYLNNFKKNVIQILIISISLIITYSVTAYILLFILISIYFLYFLKKFNKNLFYLSILLFFFFLIILINLDLNKFTDRYYLNLLDFLNTNSINTNKNLTLWSVITSIKVNIFTALHYPFGVGLGNFNLAYYDVLSNFIYDYHFFYGPVQNVYAEDSLFWYAKTVGFNDHGHSLLFRIVSELGLISLIFLALLLFFVFGLFSLDKKLFAIYLCVLIFLLGKFFKLSSYFLYGTPIFLALFMYLNFKLISEMKINKNYLYIPLVFLITFSISVFTSKKIIDEKTYSIKLYTSHSSAEYLFSVDKLIQMNFKDFDKPSFIDINYKDQKAILELKYIIDSKIKKQTIKEFLIDEFDKFSTRRNRNILPYQKNSEKFYRAELYNSSHPFWSDLNPSFFIRDDFSFKEDLLSIEELERYKNKLKAKAGIKDLTFLDNLNNKYYGDQPEGNLKAKKYKLIENLLKSQKLFHLQNRHPSPILSILINYYSNPNFKTRYFETEEQPVMYQIIINENEFPLSFNFVLVSVLFSILSCIIFFKLKK